MPFAITAASFYGTKTQGPTRRYGEQFVDLFITALNTDTVLDIGNNTGTFWTQVNRPSVLSDITTQVIPRVQSLIKVNSEDFIGRIQVATTSGPGQYEMTVVNRRPNIVWRTGDAPTNYVIQLKYILRPNQFPFFDGFGPLNQ